MYSVLVNCSFERPIEKSIWIFFHARVETCYVTAFVWKYFPPMSENKGDHNVGQCQINSSVRSWAREIKSGSMQSRFVISCFFEISRLKYNRAQENNGSKQISINLPFLVEEKVLVDWFESRIPLSSRFFFKNFFFYQGFDQFIKDTLPLWFLGSPLCESCIKGKSLDFFRWIKKPCIYAFRNTYAGSSIR